MPEPPPRQHKHERQYTPSRHSVIPTRLIWNDDYDGQMIFGDLGAESFLTFVLQVTKTPKKTSPRKPVPTGDRTRARCGTSAHATTCSTAVDEVNSDKTKYMITSRQQNIVQNQNIVIENLSFEKLENFKYLGITVTDTNDIREEIKRRINMGNACYYSTEKILSSHLLSKKLKVNTYKAIILLVVKLGLSR